MTESSRPRSYRVNTNGVPNDLGDERTITVSYRTLREQISAQQKASPEFEQLEPIKSDRKNLVGDGLVPRVEHLLPPRHRRQGLSWKMKATASAIALATVPVLALGATASYFVNQAITQQASVAKLAGIPKVAENTYLTFLLQRQLQMSLAIGTGATAVLASAIAVLLVNRAIRPVLSAAETAAVTAKRLRQQGEEEGTDFVEGDESAALEPNLNLIVYQLSDLLEQQKAEAELAQLLTDITLRLRESLNVEEVLTKAVKEAQNALKTDRVLIYRFEPDGSGTVVAESVNPGFPQILGVQIMDPCFKARHIDQYRNGRVRAIDNIYKARITDCYLEMLGRFSVKANLVAPVLKGDQLLGLLITHQCASPRAWQQSEINFFSRLAIQVGFAIDHASFLEQIEQERQELQGVLRPRNHAIAATSYGVCIADARVPDYPIIYCNPAFEKMTGYSQAELLGRNCRFLQGPDTDPAAIAEIRIALREQRECRVVLKNYRKDGSPFWNELTVSPVRDESGQITHFIGLQTDISSLRQIVLQVQAAVQAVTQTAQGNEAAIETLSAKASLQAGEVATALDAIGAIADSLQKVAASASVAKLNVQQAHQNVQAGDEAMSQTVAGIADIQATLVETTKKVKRLDEVSQKISSMVNPINSFAQQTNVLAMNVAVEAGRVGEDKKTRELMKVAEAVRSLAQQSATATAEIEQLVAEIQTATNEAFAAMKTEAEHLSAGTQLVEETRLQLGQIVAVSAQTSTLVEEIAQTAAADAQTAASMSQTMEKVAAIADHTSEQSAAVASSFVYLLELAQELQTSAAQFKVD